MEYNGESPIWDIDYNKKKGEIYFANNRNLLVYDGNFWSKLPNNKLAIIRSIFYQNDLIYTGSLNEFGFWNIQTKAYTSLSSQFNVFKNLEQEEIWKIFEFKGKIYFQSFSFLFVFDGKSVKRYKLPALSSYIFTVQDKLLLATISKGIFEFNGQDFIPKFSLIPNQQSVVHSILNQNNKYIVSTLKDGIFIVDANNYKVNPFDSNLNSELKKALILKVVLHQNKLVIGTSNNGIYVYDLKLKTYKNYNQANGLISNTIQSIKIDYNGNVWLGTDRGITKINLNSQTKLLYDHSGKLGNVFSFDIFQNSLFIGTNHGLYQYPIINNDGLKQLKSGLIWNITTIDQKLMISDSWGTYFFNDDFNKISDLNGGYKVENFGDKIIQSSFTGIFALDKNKNYATEKIANLYIPIIEFVSLGNKIVGIGKNGGLYLFDYKTKSVNEVFYQNESIENPQLIKSNNQIYVCVDGNKIQRFNVYTNKFEDYTLHSNLKNINRIRTLDDNKFLIEAENVLYFSYIKNKNLVFDLIPKKLYSGKLVDDNLVGKIFDHYLYVNLENGILKYDLNEISKQKPKIGLVAMVNNKVLDVDPKIDFANNHIDFNISVLNDEFDNYQLFYQLNNNDINSLNQSTLTFKQLESGRYKLNIYTLNDGRFELLKSFNFKIKKLWYLSDGMVTFYIIALITIAYAFYRYDRLKIDQKVNLKTKDLAHEVEMLSLNHQQELKDLNYKKEKQLLEQNLHLKSNELASQALKLANQKSLIEEITSFFSQIDGKDSEISKLKRKLNKTFSDYSYNQQEWESFEFQIQEIHKDFVVRLSQQFPNLSAKDIKLCIFLRMNLSSKEIAPLMHVNYRSIELQRYRLRKKMNISSEINLNKYMISF